MNSDVMYKGFDIEVAIIPPTGLVFGDVATGVATDTLPALMTRMRPAASVGTINAVARSMWFQSVYAEADF